MVEGNQKGPDHENYYDLAIDQIGKAQTLAEGIKEARALGDKELHNFLPFLRTEDAERFLHGWQK